MHLNRTLFLAAIAIASACTNDSTDDLIDNTPVVNVTYSQNVKSIIDNNCTMCHAATPVNGAPMSLVTYEDVKDAVQNRGLLTRISLPEGTPGMMPNGGARLPQHVIDLIVQWEAEGLNE